MRLIASLVWSVALQQAAAYQPFIDDCVKYSLNDPKELKVYECNKPEYKVGGTLASADDKAAKMTFCKFIGCGTIMVNSSAVLTNVVFENSMALPSNPSGGALSIANGTIVDMSQVNITAGVAPSGGAMYIGPTSSVTLRGSIVQSNVGTEGLGGAILVDREAKLQLIDVNIRKNVAKVGHGGAIYLREKASLTLKNSVAANNTAEGFENNGGFVFAEGGAQFISTDSTMANNTAGNRGGAIYAVNDAHLDFKMVKFSGNKATKRGGDMFLEEATLRWEQGEARGSVSAGLEQSYPQATAGGSIAMLGGTVSLSQIEFWYQNATTTGAVMHIEGASSKVEMSKIKTNYTWAIGNGGVIYAHPQTLVRCSQCVFDNCHTEGESGGGAIYSAGELMLDQVSSTNATSNRGAGSFAYIFSTSVARISNTVIDSAYFYDVNGFGDDKGALYVMGRLEMTNSNITNSISNRGSAIMAENPSSNDIDPFLNITNCQFINNTAFIGAGAVYVINAVSYWNNVVFRNNSATLWGGAFAANSYVPDRFTTVFNGKVVFTENNVAAAKSMGGALYFEGFSAVYFNTSDMTMLRNNASFGSAIYSSQFADKTGSGVISFNGTTTAAPLTTFDRINGTVFLRNEAFALKVAREGSLSVYFERSSLDSRPVGLQFKDEALVNNLNNSIIESFTLPDIVVIPCNAFGVPKKALFENSVVTFELIDGATKKIINTYNKLITNQMPDLTVTFSQTKIPTINITIAENALVIVKIFSTNGDLSTIATDPVFPDYAQTLQFKVALCKTGEQAVKSLTALQSSFVCVPQYSVTPAVKLIVSVVSMMLGVAFVGYGIRTHFKTEAYPYRIPFANMTNVMTLGSLLLLTALSMKGFFTITTYPCMSIEWIQTFGIIVTFLGMGISIFTQRQRLQGEDTHSNNLKELAKYRAISLLLATGFFMFIWHQLSPISITKTQFGGDNGWVQTDYCASDANRTSLFPTLSTLLQLVLVSSAFYLSFTTKKSTTSPHYETSSVFLIASSWLLSYTVLPLLGQFIFVTPTPFFIIDSLRILIPTILTLYLVHIRLQMNPALTTQATLDKGFFKMPSQHNLEAVKTNRYSSMDDLDDVLKPGDADMLNEYEGWKN